jgi:hypothetical protein
VFGSTAWHVPQHPGTGESTWQPIDPPRIHCLPKGVRSSENIDAGIRKDSDPMAETVQLSRSQRRRVARTAGRLTELASARVLLTTRAQTRDLVPCLAGAPWDGVLGTTARTCQPFQCSGFVREHSRGQGASPKHRRCFRRVPRDGCSRFLQLSAPWPFDAATFLAYLRRIPSVNCPTYSIRVRRGSWCHCLSIEPPYANAAPRIRLWVRGHLHVLLQSAATER